VRLRHALSLPSTLPLSAGSCPALHVAVCWPRNEYTILAEVDERITQLQYFLLAQKNYALRGRVRRTSENYPSEHSSV
jgi:hypothetical protein